MQDEMKSKGPVSASPEKESPGLEFGRRDLIKAAFALSSATVFSGLLENSADAQGLEKSSNALVINPKAIRPGVLFKVQSASGVRAGRITQADSKQPLSVNRKSFGTSDAYSDAGYWYFCYESNEMLAAARVFTSNSSGKKVGYVALGQRTNNGPELISSMGTLVFEKSKSGRYLECRVRASNYYDLEQEKAELHQSSSPYFISTQVLQTLKPDLLDADTKARINGLIQITADRLGWDQKDLIFC